MEDYDVFLEMQDIDSKQTIMFVEDDEDFVINNLLKSKYECIPIRFSYDVSQFSAEYVNMTKKLFIYYYDENNSTKNESFKMKKHFIHYRRTPFICYLPLKYLDNSNIAVVLKQNNIEIISDKEQFLKKINNINKLVFIDNDGTLKNSNGKITSRTKNAIKKIKSENYYIVICSSRPRYQIKEIMDKSFASKYIVTSNGAEIYDTKNEKIIYENFMDKTLVIKYVEYAFEKNLRLIISSSDKDYVTKEVRNPNQVLIEKNNYIKVLNDKQIKQCMFIDENVDGINIVKEKIKMEKKLKIVDEISINDNYYEKWFSFSDLNTSKGNALKIMADYLNIPYINTIAIGNDKNDISMFELSGFSVAMGNSSNHIKKIANFVTLSNDEDGVAFILEKILNDMNNCKS